MQETLGDAKPAGNTPTIDRQRYDVLVADYLTGLDALMLKYVCEARTPKRMRMAFKFHFEEVEAAYTAVGASPYDAIDGALDHCVRRAERLPEPLRTHILSGLTKLWQKKHHNICLGRLTHEAAERAQGPIRATELETATLSTPDPPKKRKGTDPYFRSRIEKELIPAMEAGGLTPRTLAQEMKRRGIKIKPSTIKSLVELRTNPQEATLLRCLEVVKQLPRKTPK